MGLNDDTIIMIANTSNMHAKAKCMYIQNLPLRR